MLKNFVGVGGGPLFDVLILIMKASVVSFASVEAGLIYLLKIPLE